MSKYIVFADFGPAPDIDFYDTYEEALKEAEDRIESDFYNKCDQYIAKVEVMFKSKGGEEE